MISQPVFRYFIHLSYNGSGFNGWQKQENAPSVQQVLEQAFAYAGGITSRLTGCGRTDTGVHAKIFYAHFDHNESLNKTELDKITFKINRYLPFSIAVQRIFPVMPEAHARFSPVLREYQYNILLAKDPFLENSAYYIWGDLDVGAMNKAATLLKQFTDFECFSKTNTQVKTYNCRIIEAGWKRDGNLLVFTIRADRFLRNMVRAIVGTLLDVGRHKLSQDDLKRIVESRNRSNAGYSVPAKGLFLTDVLYPDTIFSDHPVAFLPDCPDEIKAHYQADSQLHDGAGDEADE